MTAPDAPLLRVVKGNQTPEELAAVLIVVAARSGPADGPRQETNSGWSAYWRSVKAPLAAGPGAWRSSAHPN